VSKVYVVQVPARRSGPRGAWEEKYDLSPAERFGELVRLLPYGNVPADPRPTVEALKEGLKDFRASEDFLLLLGDPVACAQAVQVLTRRMACFRIEPHFNVLKWDRREGVYYPYQIG
jgi:hypothetical protein